MIRASIPTINWQVIVIYGIWTVCSHKQATQACSQWEHTSVAFAPIALCLTSLGLRRIRGGRLLPTLAFLLLHHVKDQSLYVASHVELDWGKLLINRGMCTRLGLTAASDLWNGLGPTDEAPLPTSHPFSVFPSSGSCPVMGWAQSRGKKPPLEAGGFQKMVLRPFVPWMAEVTWCKLPWHHHGGRHSPCVFALTLYSLCLWYREDSWLFPKREQHLNLTSFPDYLISIADFFQMG